jgi:hypothetical protein
MYGSETGSVYIITNLVFGIREAQKLKDPAPEDWYFDSPLWAVPPVRR